MQEKEDLYYSSVEHAINVWGECPMKTQGRPYHLAILVVGIWLEQFFEGRGFLQGDFDQKQVDKAISWMYEHTNRPLVNPVLLDMPPLVELC